MKREEQPGGRNVTRTAKTLLATAIGTAALSLSAASAFADYVACSGNTCWHVKERYTYPKAR